jgi:hypothetical protein
MVAPSTRPQGNNAVDAVFGIPPVARDFLPNVRKDMLQNCRI